MNINRPIDRETAESQGVNWKEFANNRPGTGSRLGARFPIDHQPGVGKEYQQAPGLLRINIEIFVG